MAYPASTGKHIINPHDSKPARLTTKEAYGELLIGATAVQITVAVAGTHLPVLHASTMTSGQSNNVALDGTAGTLTITGGNQGKYRVYAFGEFLGVNSAVKQISIGKDGTEDANTLRTRTEPASAVYDAFSIEKVLDLDVGDVLTLRVDSDSNSDTVDVRACVFGCYKLFDDGTVDGN